MPHRTVHLGSRRGAPRGRASAPAAAMAGLSGLLAWTAPTAAQVDRGAPIGPCSPYETAEGDIPSEMPGCARHLRPAPGSLDDEMQFRRARRRDDADPDPADTDEAPRRRRKPRP